MVLCMYSHLLCKYIHQFKLQLHHIWSSHQVENKTWPSPPCASPRVDVDMTDELVEAAQHGNVEKLKVFFKKGQEKSLLQSAIVR